jgi:transposase-like protein
MPSGKKIILTSEQIKEIIHDYTINYLSAKNIAEKFKIKCSKFVTKILNQNNILIRNQKESIKLLSVSFSDEESKQILEAYKNPEIDLTDLAKKVNYDPQTIKKFLIKQNVYNESKFDDHLIKKLDIIETEKQAYWLGFLAADGSATKKQLNLLLAEKDLDHLLKFKEFIGVDYKIRKKKTILNDKIFYGYLYSVSSTKFVQSIIKHNIYPNKSFTIEIPNTIPHHLLHHYIRGLFDGDGSICDYKNKLLFTITSSTKMCIQVQKILVKNCNLSYVKIANLKSTVSEDYYSILSYCGNGNNIKIYEFLYKDATIFLERKKSVFNKILQNY